MFDSQRSVSFETVEGSVEKTLCISAGVGLCIFGWGVGVFHKATVPFHVRVWRD